MTSSPGPRKRFFAESVINACPALDAGLTLDSHSPPRRERGGRKRRNSGSQVDLFQQLTERDILLALFSQSLSWADAGVAASDIIAEFGTSADAVAASHTKLRCLRSLPPAAIALLQCVQVATARLAQARIQNGPILNNWSRLEEYLRITMARLALEECRALLLDPRNRLIRDELIATGGVRSVPV